MIYIIYKETSNFKSVPSIKPVKTQMHLKKLFTFHPLFSQ